MRRHWRSRWRGGWRRCGPMRGWRRSGWGRCRGRRWPGRPERWPPVRCRRGWSMSCTRGRRATRSSPSSWWPPAWPAELLAVRTGRCAGDARAVLAGLAVAGRPVAEDVLGAVTGLEVEAVRRGLRELAAARLLAEDAAGGGHRLRHALLAEAVAGGLLPGERAVLHERAARALASAGDPALAAEVAGHWQAAGRPAEEFPARVAAAEAAERVFGYAQAAAHWQRAVGLGQAQPGAAAAGIDVPRLSVRAIDAFFRAGDRVNAALVAEQAYRRFAGHPDTATAAVICHRTAVARVKD